jgi:hypothetical protein
MAATQDSQVCLREKSLFALDAARVLKGVLALLYVKRVHLKKGVRVRSI